MTGQAVARPAGLHGHRDLDATRAYLDVIGRVEMLDAEQEVQLAKRMEAGLYADELLTNQSERVDSDLKDDLQVIVEEGRAAKNHLLEANLRLVVSIATRHTGRGVPLLDLIQEGNLGLIRAAEKFDYAKGVKFSTYATWWIRHTITRVAAGRDRTIRIPQHVVEVIQRLGRARRQLQQRLGSDPSQAQIAESAGIPAETLAQLREWDRPPVSLDQPLSEDGHDSLIDLLPAPGAADPADVVADRDERDRTWRRVETLLADLSPRERAVIRLRYGFVDDRARTLPEVGRVVGVSGRWVRQIERTTLLKLKRRAGAAA